MPESQPVPFLDLRAIRMQRAERLQAAFSGFLQRGHYILGEQVAGFEQEFARYCGVPHCVGVGNGLDALELIFEGYLQLGVMQAGDEVIVPANTYIASILAVSRTGLVPVPVEPDPATGNIDPACIESKITNKTRAILVVHLYGRLAAMEAIGEIASRHSLKVVEDAAQAHGARPSGMARESRAGALGDAAGFSFYPTKNLGALGDAGAVTTRDAELAAALRAVRNYGSVSKNNHRYKGRNSRMDELQATFLRIGLETLDEDNARRREIAARYLAEIRNPAITLPLPASAEESVWHLFVVRVAGADTSGTDQVRAAFQKHLSDRGIETAVHYPVPPHHQEAFREWVDIAYPITEALHRESLSLPLALHLTDSDVGAVIAAVNSFGGA